MRSDARNAAGRDGIVSKADQSMLGPYLESKAASMREGRPGLRLSVDRLVDRAMSDAMKTWSQFNPKSSPRDHVWLSQRETRAIDKADPNLGVMTLAAVRRVQLETPAKDPALIPVVTIESAVPGFSISSNGDIFTIRADKSVPTGSKFRLVIDGHQSIEMTRNAMGLTTYLLEPPAGYSAEDISRKVTAGAIEEMVRIRKDPANFLTAEQALVVARDALKEYVQNVRVNDSDWKDMIGMTWDQAVAHGVLDDIANFATTTADGDSGVISKPDSFIFVGRGPLELYTEVSVAKKDGKVTNVYVEID